MRLKTILKSKFFQKSAKKVVDKTADVITRNPEAASLSETLIKRFTAYVHIGDRLLHFHELVFGVMLGFTLMTGIIALGKFAAALGVAIFLENNDLIFNIGYFGFFAGIITGFIKHYRSRHHKILFEKNVKKLERAYFEKENQLQTEFSEKRESLEEEFIERSRKLAGMIKEQEDEIQFLKEEAKRQKQIIEAQKEDKNVWDALSSYNPIKRSKSRN